MDFIKPYSANGIAILTPFQKLFLALLFAAFIFIGIGIAEDYGVPWDDHLQQEVGKQNFELATEGNRNIYNSHDQFYGSAFELPLYFFQSYFSTYSIQIYVRHILTHLYFLLSLFFFFKLILKLFSNYSLAIISILFIYLSPRIFAHSFFNTKDIPFLSAFIISIYTMLQMVEKPSDFKRVLFHAFASAFLIDIRIIGIIIPAITWGIFIIQRIENSASTNVRKSVVSYFGALIAFIILMWPALWYNPLILIKSFIRMSQFPWVYNNLFNGEFIAATNLPFYYIPLWIAISTPIAITFLYFIGVYFCTISLFKKNKHSFFNYNTYLFILIVLPIDLWLLFSIIGSTFYDGWRHLFFIYPLLVLGGIYGLNSIFTIIKHSKVKYSIYILIAILFAFNIKSIIELHPYQQVYFNSLISNDNNSIKNNWEMDYWGLCYKEGFEKILQLDSAKDIKVKTINISATDNWRLVNETDSRIILVNNIDSADYFISNYRFHPQEYPYIKIDSIQRQGSSILGIYKLK